MLGMRLRSGSAKEDAFAPRAGWTHGEWLRLDRMADELHVDDRYTGRHGGMVGMKKALRH